MMMMTALFIIKGITVPKTGTGYRDLKEQLFHDTEMKKKTDTGYRKSRNKLTTDTGYTKVRIKSINCVVSPGLLCLQRLCINRENLIFQRRNTAVKSASLSGKNPPIYYF